MKETKCQLCHKPPKEGCSHIACPARKTLSAAPKESMHQQGTSAYSPRPKLSDEFGE